MNCEAYSTFEGESYDRRVVTVKKRLSLRRYKKEKNKALQYNQSSFANNNIYNH